MKILCLDIGTGTQDILLFDSEKEIENCFRLVMPSPTVLVAQRIRAATERGEPVLLTGSIMGGGPNSWAAEDHLRAGLALYATPEAARSFNDDLDEVRKSGIRVVDESETKNLRAARVALRDVDLDAVSRAFAAFEVPFDFDALAVAVFDHGNAPPGVSDRRFRFDFLAERIHNTGRLSGFAFMREDVPERLTRMRAVADSVNLDVPLIMMDTAPAAVLGALDDPVVRSRPNSLVANIGNFHALAFRFTEGAISGVLEHHTGELTRPQFEGFLAELAGGTLTNDAIFDSQGHGAVIFDARPQPLDFLAVLGPRRGLMNGSHLNPYYAVPHGDMMLAGAFGLLHAYADLNPDVRDEITARLRP